jgi:hypothetical protein
MSLDAQIDDLHNQGILKSHRTAFLIFKDNYIPFSYIYSKEKYNEEIKKIKENNNNQLAKYYNYLPRQIKYIPNLFIAHPELENYYSHNKKGYNEFNAYRRNKLTCEDEKIDWLIYDKESINFLLKMNKINLEEMSFLKYKDGIVYFEDKCKVDDGRKSYSSTLKNQRLTDEKLKKVFANLTIDTAKPGQNSNLVANKMKVDTSTTAKDLIEKMCKKLNSIKKDLNIDTESKILKVKSLNDYIFDINEPLINYTYFNECVKLNKTPEYLIIDNPFITEVSEDAMNQIYGDNTKQSFFSSLKGDNLRGSSIRRVTLSSSMPTPINKGKNALENIAFYDKNKDENIKGVNVKADLEKIVNKSSKSTSAPAPTPKKGGGTGDINSLIDLLVKEVDQNIQSQSKTNNSSTKNVIKEINNNEIKPKKLNNKSIKSNHLFLDLNPNGSEYFSSRKRYRNRQPKLEKNIFNFTTLKGEIKNPVKKYYTIEMSHF